MNSFVITSSPAFTGTLLAKSRRDSTERKLAYRKDNVLIVIALKNWFAENHDERSGRHDAQTGCFRHGALM